ncbi:Olfactory receptor 12D2 [Microtus ochrogaster]|uniref:Olfactory receptor 12D2 n=1 Tax=Microtus ochrogaster TaxID=79684 RepID=A0A8J6KPF5_MICOH|nr:Olfactory receptor 12D2 [Microtus ochrogaster]
MLENFLSTSKAISFLGCITQLHFFHFLGSTEALLLAVMAFDRFMAICKPLHYPFIMNRQVCIQMAFTIWAIPFLHALLHSIMTSRLNFCGSNHIHHFFCDVKPLLELACGNTELNRWLLNTLTGTIAIGLFFLTFLSYFYIITHLFLKTRSCSMLHKALSTCASHFMVVVIFYAPVLYIYISPASGSSLEEDRIIAVMYTVVTPALNPLIYTLRNKEVMSNQTSVIEFFLLGVTDIQEPQPFLFAVFITIYFVNITGNGAILTIVISDTRLHSPMYFFLGNLACLDICYSTVTVPKMLENFLSTSKAISFLGCITQLHFFHFLGTTESLLLAVMAFDRFVAICKPLRYSVIMSRQLCILMAVAIWTIAFLHALLHSVMTSRLRFCGSNQIHHFFCDVKPLLELACGNTELNLWLLNTVTGTVASVPFFLTFLSYFYIITYLFLKTRSCSMLHKAMSTCASHFMVVILFYAPVILKYIRPSSGSSLDQDRVIAVMYSVVTPALNPLIYTLRNKEVRSALTRKMRRWLRLDKI